MKTLKDLSIIELKDTLQQIKRYRKVIILLYISISSFFVINLLINLTINVDTPTVAFLNNIDLVIFWIMVTFCLTFIVVLNNSIKINILEKELELIKQKLSGDK